MAARIIAKHQDRLRAAIELMERVDAHKDAKFYIGSWRGAPTKNYPEKTFSETLEISRSATTELELHQCGTPACFAGWVAVSKEFKEAGGTPGRNGSPIFDRLHGAAGMAEYLGIPENEARKLTWTSVYSHLYYGTEVPTRVTPLMVAEKLKQYLE